MTEATQAYTVGVTSTELTLEQKQAIMTKKITEMTSADFDAITHTIGDQDTRLPMVVLEENTSGKTITNVGMIQSHQAPLRVFSPYEFGKVYGTIVREQSTPNMMIIERDFWSLMSPDSKNKQQTIMGDASSGKSHDSLKVAALVHPKGGLRIDCGGMNMRELFFRTVIDYGKGVQDLLNKKADIVGLKQGSIDALNKAFDGAVVNGKVNWDMIGQPKRVVDPEDSTKTVIAPDDDGDKAVQRAKEVLTNVYMSEGISAQDNAFGIKTVKGEILVSLEEGRPIILDEFNKSKAGTLDSFQTFLEYANGEQDSFTVQNPMADESPDSPKSYTFERKDQRFSWFMRVLGNETKDGSTTQDISYSMKTRLKPSYVGAPDLADWRHRVSQVWTGMPITTWYDMLSKKSSVDKSEVFAEAMWALRTAGLSDAEIAAIPSHQKYLITNYADTVQAINQYAGYMSTRLALSDPASEEFNKSQYGKMGEEVGGNSQRIAVSFRTVIEDFAKALRIVPEVVTREKVTFDFNVAAAIKRHKSNTNHTARVGWHRLGEGLGRVMLEGMVNDTVGMPESRETLKTLLSFYNIIPSKLDEARKEKNTKLLSKLLKFDDLASLGGTEELKRVQGLLLAYVDGILPKGKKRDGNDDKAIPLSTLGQVMLDLKDKQEVPRVFIVPNGDLSTITASPLIEGLAIQNYVRDAHNEETGDYIGLSSIGEEIKNSHVLEDFRAALAAISLPQYGDLNRKRIWAEDLFDHIGEQTEEHYNIVRGQSKIKCDMTVLEVADIAGKSTYMFLIEDKKMNKGVIVGPDVISSHLESELKKQNFTYVSTSDKTMVADEENVTENGVEKVIKSKIPLTAKVVNDFLAEGATLRGKDGEIKTGDTQGIIENMVKCYSSMCGKEEGIQEKGITIGKLLYEGGANPAVYTSIYKPKKLGMGM